ncbi:MAG TPA: GIY-YIG nuclease family protein [Pseudomonadota bacterium]|nr:GIY-YIG nuclease family protein [Ottowia sp.]HNN96215.1 GIY-YIG nuclease family protein [Pseudomonadota bacterium]
MGLKRNALLFAATQPDTARQVIRGAARTGVPEHASQIEYVYLFQGLDYRTNTAVHKLGRSRKPEARIKQVRNLAYFAEWEPLHHICCFSTSRFGWIASVAEPLESLFHGLFAPYQTAQAFGKEYFTLPDDEVQLVCSINYIHMIALNVGILDRGTDHMNEDRWQ